MAIRRVLGLGELDRGRPAAVLDEIGPDAHQLAADLSETMRSAPSCVGLAAPQIGVPVRAFVVDVTGHKKTVTCHGELVIFNPEILFADAPMLAREGCLSVPDLTGDVARATRIVVRGLSLDGVAREFETDAFEARAILHEIDHLDGLVFLDRLAHPGALHVRRVYR